MCADIVHEMYTSCVQTSCANCNFGNNNDRVTYEWRVDSNSDDTQMDDVDITTYSVMSSTDGSITIDVDGFLPVVTNQSLRQVVYCRLVLDMDHHEIAAELALASADSARALFHKALGRLRTQLDLEAD